MANAWHIQTKLYLVGACCYCKDKEYKCVAKERHAQLYGCIDFVMQKLLVRMERHESAKRISENRMSLFWNRLLHTSMNTIFQQVNTRLFLKILLNASIYGGMPPTACLANVLSKKPKVTTNIISKRHMPAWFLTRNYSLMKC